MITSSEAYSLIMNNMNVKKEHVQMLGPVPRRWKLVGRYGRC